MIEIRSAQDPKSWLARVEVVNVNGVGPEVPRYISSGVDPPSLVGRPEYRAAPGWR